MNKLINFIRDETNGRALDANLFQRRIFREQTGTKDLLFFYSLVFK